MIVTFVDINDTIVCNIFKFELFLFMLFRYSMILFRTDISLAA